MSGRVGVHVQPRPKCSRFVNDPFQVVWEGRQIFLRGRDQSAFWVFSPVLCRFPRVGDLEKEIRGPVPSLGEWPTRDERRTFEGVVSYLADAVSFLGEEFHPGEA